MRPPLSRPGEAPPGRTIAGQQALEPPTSGEGEAGIAGPHGACSLEHRLVDHLGGAAVLCGVPVIEHLEPGPFPLGHR